MDIELFPSFSFLEEFGKFSSVTQLCPTLCDSINCRTPGLPVPSSTPGVYPNSYPWSRTSNHLIFCRPLLLLPSIFPSIRVFSNESALHIRWPKCWSFSFISPSSEHSGLISFRKDRLDLLAVKGTLKSLPQQQVQQHQFFSTQLSL